MKISLLSKFRVRTALEVIAIISAIIISYYEIKEFNPPDPVIILEISTHQNANQAPVYLLTGAAADKEDYVLEYMKLYLQTPHQVKRAYFKYGLYTKPVELKARQNQALDAYMITNDLLQQAFEEDDNFAFHFPKPDSSFYFEFEKQDQVINPKTVEFRCETQATEHLMVPCEIKEGGYLSLVRGIPWYLLAVILGLIFIIVIEVLVKLWQFFRRDSQKNRNKLTRDRGL